MEEWMLYFGLAVVIFFVLLGIQYVRGNGNRATANQPARVDNRRPQPGPRVQGNRRAAGVRNRRPGRRIGKTLYQCSSITTFLRFVSLVFIFDSTVKCEQFFVLIYR